MDDRARVIGVTGGMGTGKSTVSAFFNELGGILVEADEIAHCVFQNQGIADAIARRFGADIIDQNGLVKRSTLGVRVFVDAGTLSDLYEIVRTPIEDLLFKHLDDASRYSSSGIVIFDAPLLYEWSLESWCDYVVAVVAPKENCIERIVNRNEMSRSEIEKRMKLQIDPRIKEELADYCINNTGSIHKLRNETEIIWKNLKCK